MRSRSAPLSSAQLLALVEVAIDRLKPRNDRTNLIGSQPVKRLHMRKLHQPVRDLARTRRERPRAIETVLQRIQILRMRRNQIVSHCHPARLNAGPDASRRTMQSETARGAPCAPLDRARMEL
jgi:hypothetical protein